MAEEFIVQMKQFNGIDYDEIYPKARNVMSPEIILVPTSGDTIISATIIFRETGDSFEGALQSDGKMIFQVNKFGIYDISVNAQNQGLASGEINVEICKQYEFDLFPKADPILNNNSWEIIKKYSDANKAESTWSVGDAKQITLNGTIGFEEFNNLSIYYVYILGFNHNSSREGTGITFGSFKSALSNGEDACLIDSYYDDPPSSDQKCFNMSRGVSNNKGGWKGCDMRYDILGSTHAKNQDANSTTTTSPVADTLMAAFPGDLRAVMKPMNIWTDNNGEYFPSISKSIDYLPLLAEFEIFGTRTYANSNEKNYQEQYQYYKNGNSKIKSYLSQSTGSPYYEAPWWSRSPRASSDTDFCLISKTGNQSFSKARESYGIAPIFRV